MPKQGHTIIAETFSMDAADVKEFRYQEGHTRQPVFAIGDQYFAVSQRRPKEKGYAWREYSDQGAARAARTVLWVADACDDIPSASHT